MDTMRPASPPKLNRFRGYTSVMIDAVTLFTTILDLKSTFFKSAMTYRLVIYCYHRNFSHNYENH